MIDWRASSKRLPPHVKLENKFVRTFLRDFYSGNFKRKTVQNRNFIDLGRFICLLGSFCNVALFQTRSDLKAENDSRSEEALEAPQCPIPLDVGQIDRCFRPKAFPGWVFLKFRHPNNHFQVHTSNASACPSSSSCVTVFTTLWMARKSRQSSNRYAGFKIIQWK